MAIKIASLTGGAAATANEEKNKMGMPFILPKARRDQQVKRMASGVQQQAIPQQQTTPTQPQQTAAAYGAYTPSTAVTEARSYLNGVLAQEPGKYQSPYQRTLDAYLTATPAQYTPGQAVQAAQQRLDAIDAQRPGEYVNPYQRQMDAYLNRTPAQYTPTAEEKRLQQQMAALEGQRPGEYVNPYQGRMDAYLNRDVPQYTPSAAVQEAQQYLNTVRGNKPGSYQSAYQERMDGLIDRIQGRQPFTYDAAADPLYQVYADRYTVNGRRAMEDTMGQAAGLTGGYGSSYGQAAGQQMYNQYMEGLNDTVPQLAQLAYQRYQDEGDRLTQQYQLMADQDDRLYGRSRDAYQNWLQEMGLAQQGYESERGFDYGVFSDNEDRLARQYEQLAAMDETLRGQHQNDRSFWLQEMGQTQDRLESARNFGFNQYQDYEDRLAQQYGQWAAADNTQYGRYRDAVGDWRQDRQDAYGRLQNERDFDYGVFSDGEDRLAQRYAMLADRDDALYGRSQDAYGNWLNKAQLAQGRLESERGFDRDVYESDRDFDWKKSTDERDYNLKLNRYETEDSQWEKQFAYTQQADEIANAMKQQQIDNGQMSEAREYAYDTAIAVLKTGQMPTAQLLADAGISREDAQLLAKAYAPAAQTSGSSTRSSSTSSSTAAPAAKDTGTDTKEKAEQAKPTSFKDANLQAAYNTVTGQDAGNPNYGDVLTPRQYMEIDPLQQEYAALGTTPITVGAGMNRYDNYAEDAVLSLYEKGQITEEKAQDLMDRLEAEKKLRRAKAGSADKYFMNIQ